MKGVQHVFPHIAPAFFHSDYSFPRQFNVSAPEVSVARRRRIDRPLEPQRLDDPPRREPEALAHEGFQLLVRSGAGAVGIDLVRYRPFPARWRMAILRASCR